MPCVNESHSVWLELPVSILMERHNGEVLWWVVYPGDLVVELFHVDEASNSWLLAGKEGVPVSDLEILLSQVEHVRDAAVVYVNVEHV